MQFKILLSRFLTRFGDQAWDFAVPLILIQIFPGKIQLIAFIYLFAKLTQIVLGPIISRKIDTERRSTIYKLGIGSQTLAMIFMWCLIVLLINNGSGSISLSPQVFYLVLGLIALLSAAASLGSSLMDISVSFDLSVEVLPADELSHFNSRLKRLDLFTEVTAPVFTGSVLALFSYNPVIGFSIIAAANILTFVPEYFLLKMTQTLKLKKILSQPIVSSSNFLIVFIESLKKLKNKPYSLVIVAYAFLWLSVLSPHGVLLTSYLKDGGKISEFSIGIFRGLGAFFGLIPTFIFPALREKYGLILSSKFFLGFQLLCITLTTLFFYSSSNIYFFLLFILLSRIGLYGFSIGETEMRQILIPKELRGEVNGIANSTTSMATLCLFLFGIIIGDTQNFDMMIFMSLAAVIISFGLFMQIKPLPIKS